MITKQTRVVLATELDVVDLAGEKAMIDFETGKYFLLKGPANGIWDLIQTDISGAEIGAELRKSYEVDEAACLQSTITFLERLDSYGFLSVTCGSV